MDMWDAITSRRQVRSFAAKPISSEALHRVLEAGRRAPSARNSQPWNFVVVTDQDQLHQLSQTWQGAAWIAGAAATIALVMPEQSGEALLLDRSDLGQAAMQMMLAAAGLGIGSGQAACRDQALAQRVLGFPDGHHCALLIALGHPADRPLRPIRKPRRRAFDDVVHFDRW